VLIVTLAFGLKFLERGQILVDAAAEALLVDART
jgi:hypothetical protein